jgi:hypothetical protein
VTGGPTNDFYSGSCATTGEDQYTVWWMLAFPGNTIYFTNVKIFYRDTSKCISKEYPARRSGAGKMKHILNSSFRFGP